MIDLANLIGVDWQTAATVSVVACALAYLALRLAKVVRGNTQGGCGSCSQSNEESGLRQKPLVQIQSDSGDRTAD